MRSSVHAAPEVIRLLADSEVAPVEIGRFAKRVGEIIAQSRGEARDHRRATDKAGTAQDWPSADRRVRRAGL